LSLSYWRHNPPWPDDALIAAAPPRVRASFVKADHIFDMREAADVDAIYEHDQARAVVVRPGCAL
jgi:hypothetical protein